MWEGPLFWNDDWYLVGPVSVVLPALERFSKENSEKFLLRLQVGKTEVFPWEDTLPSEVPEKMRGAGTVV